MNAASATPRAPPFLVPRSELNRDEHEPPARARTLRPVILTVADDHDVLGGLVASVGRRFGADYAVLDASGPAAAYTRLAALHDTGAEVALIAASHRMAEEPGTAFLARTRDLFPTARRLVLASFVDLTAMPEIARASMLGEIDAYERLPFDRPRRSVPGLDRRHPR